ncbi:endoplasmic reticulum protein [Phellopilus nigrolimitatus]|nr:endoplasmic reticulum protein [Phellopilus nigrolimitatus]KAH8112025.1 endoplasmic reticulum protein [Phellopilus nigrolimitatus]
MQDASPRLRRPKAQQIHFNMTIYYSLTFLLLAAEMVTFCGVVAPLPRAVRRRVFAFLSESAVVAKVAYGLKIAFIFVGVLFVDALQRMFRITAEAEAAKTGGGSGVHDVRAETNFAARKFYAQRNTYLTGFALFLSLVLTRTFYIILDLIHAQDEYAKLKKSAEGSGKSGEDVEQLKKKLAAAESRARDFDILKKQSEAQAREYDRLATEFNQATGAVSDKRKD